jgi:DNA adenine methylase
VCMAKPFLKWVGGKTQLLSEIENRLPLNINELDTYVEPFIGGGAVLFHMLRTRSFKNIYISDINPELILCYRLIKTNVIEIIKHLEKLQTKFHPLSQDKRKEMFNLIRKKWNKGINFDDSAKHSWLVERVAKTMFLNRTCFNGLFRVNSKGEFNVPIGSYKMPQIVNKENLLSVSKVLVGVNINIRSYDKCGDYIDENSFVYFDPPYRPLGASSSFTSYVKSGFNDDDQINLKKFY